MTWRPIAELRREYWRRDWLLAHDTKRWIRFGRFFPEQGEWYYSGTNERSQWAQTRGDEPTHYQPMPALPECPK